MHEKRNGSIIILTLESDLTAPDESEESAVFYRRLHDLRDQPHNTIIILSAVKSVNSIGMFKLVATARALELAKCRMVMVDTSQITDAFVGGFFRVNFKVYPNEMQALASFQSDPLANT